LLIEWRDKVLNGGDKVLNGGIRWVALREGRKRLMEGDMSGRGIRKKGLLEFREGEHFGLLEFGEEEHFESRDCIFCLGYFLVRSLGDLYTGAPGCWEFWASGVGILTESWS